MLFRSQMEGYDIPQYANVQYPWDGVEQIEPGEVPTRFNPIASYVKYVTLPSYFEGKKVILSLQGVESAFSLWVNGQYVGYSEDSFTPSEFDLTKFLVTGENKIALKVWKWSASSWIEDQDFFRFSGIFRDVYLYIVPDVHVSDVKILTELDNSYTQANLSVTCKANNAGFVIVSLNDRDKEVFSIEQDIAGDFVINKSISMPRLWSAEEPNLYQLKVKVYNQERQ